MAAAEWDASGPSFGVDRADWPGTLKGARAMLRSMPGHLDGASRHYYYNSGEPDDPARDAGVVYGESASVQVYEEYVSTDTAGGKPEMFSANNQLAAAFGLVFACAKGTYRGTAPKPSHRGGGPGVTRKPITEPVWFSCVIGGAEGDESFTGQAVGWTSRKTAWLVIEHDEAATRAMVSALHRVGT